MSELKSPQSAPPKWPFLTVGLIALVAIAPLPWWQTVIAALVGWWVVEAIQNHNAPPSVPPKQNQELHAGDDFAKHFATGEWDDSETTTKRE